MKLVLLDRDGVLNTNLPTSVHRPEELEMLPGSAKAVARLNQAGMTVVVCTNQSIIGRGVVTEETLQKIHAQLAVELAKEGAHVDQILFCPDAPERATSFRKPGPGMLLKAMSDYGIEEREAIMVGDALRDIQAAFSAGCHRILVRTGHGAKTIEEGLLKAYDPVIICQDLADAVTHILERKAV